MEEDSEYKKLPTEEKCVHKLWKARVTGYEEAAKLFKQIDDDKSPEWNKYLGLIKKMVADSNAVAQEKGLEAALAFVENCGHAGKTVGEVMSGIVTKCIAAPKTKTKDLSLQVTLMYVEIEKHEAVQEELIKGTEHKNPKIASACVSAITTALRQFGNKVVSIKLLVKKIPTLLADRDKDVRTEMKALVVEMHRWIGPALEPHISQLQPVVLQELRDAFSDAGMKVTPERYLRSQQVLARPTASDSQGNDDGGDDQNDDGDDAKDGPDIDPFDLLDPVDILSKLPKDFYEKLDDKKWQERKEALDALETLLKEAPKLEQGDYGDLVRAMKKVISKDSNVILVALAGRCVSMMAVALKRRFQTYTSALLPCAFEKFKEKKPNVVTALREAVDAMYQCTTIEAIAEDVVEALNNKNPTVKAETASFLARAIARTQPAALTKKLLKVYVPALLKVLESADPIVRDQAAEALGTATKLVGEKNISPFIGKLDNLKEQKIQECCEKAVILVRVQKEPRPKTAPAAKADAGKAGSTQPKAVKRPTTAGAKKPGAKKAVGGAAAKPAASGKAPPPREVMEREMSPDEVDMRAGEIMDPSVLTGLIDPNWKTRLDAVQSFMGGLPDIPQGDGTTQVLFRILNKKPGLKDTNFQVLKLRLEAIKAVSEKFPVSITCVDSILSDIVEKLSDAKCSQAAAEALTALSEATRLDYVACQSLEYALEKQKSPRVQTEIFAWLCSALREFGMVVNSKSVLVHVKKALAVTNPAVRTAAVSLIGTMYLFMGASLNQFIDGEKPAIKQQIQLELEKNADEDIPTPIRGMSKSASKGSMDDLNDDMEEDFASGGSPPPTQDVRPKMDIAPLITEALIQEINDKNWKVRNEALEKVKTIITEAQSIKSSVGELPQALVPRLLDSNSKIAQMALHICEVLVTAIGPKAKVHIRLLFPGIFQGLGDSKTWIRSAALQCINVWTTQCGVPSIFEGEIVFDALKSGSPTLRAELWTWLSEKLPGVTPKAIPREELSVCVPLLYTALEDRGADVRKAAGEAVLGFMMHLGPDPMVRQAEKLKPGSKTVVHAALDKARPNLPVQPLPKTDSKAIKSGGAQAKAQGGGQQKPGQAKPTKGIVKSASASSARAKGKDDDNESLVPLLPINNIKHQRSIDDQKLKVLKWNFLTPREEFFDLLKDQMATAGLNKILVSNMFHADFRYHIKAIESLIEDLPVNGPALIANLDLVFKWLTLRFFDTNPSVLLRGLEYLNAVFNYLMAEDYHMAEYEANCFIPYLVLKVGDPKDTVRNGVKSLLKQICIVYSVSKLFGYLMEGLKSKNARQRTECLDVLGLLIESYGVSICNPSAMAALKEIARQISDRDNSVRNAALNCVVQAYFLEGEKIYKMIGQISDKDHSLLEERIKRAAKGRDTSNRKSMLLPLSATGRPIQPEKNNAHMEQNPQSNDYDDEEEEQMNDYPPPPMRVHAVGQREQARPISGPFGLDPGVVAAIEQGLQEDIRLMTKQPQLQEMDLSFLDEPVAAPTIGSSVRPVSSTVPLSPPMRVPMPVSMPMSMGMPMQMQMQPNSVMQPMPPSQLVQPVAPIRYEQDNILTRTIQNIASPNISVAINALTQMDSILRSNRANLMSPYEEQLLLAIVEQLQIMQQPDHNLNHADSFNAYRYLMSVLVCFYDGKIAGRNVSPSTIAALVDQLLKLLISRALEKGAADGEDKMVRAANSVCVKVLERSDHTALIIALVDLLDKSVAGDPPYPRYQELEMKCLWKVMKMIPSWETDALDYDRLLHRLHLFFKAYPSTYWKANSQLNDTPFRTVKTLVHTLFKKKGNGIMRCLSQIPDIRESELYPYLQKLFKTLKVEEGKVETAPPAERSPLKMPRMVQEELSQIIKRIGEKEHSKEGLKQLYDLTQRHPTVDIWLYLRDTSLYFKNYIDRGLKQVEEEREMGLGEAPAPLPLANIPLSAMAISHNNIPSSDADGASSKGPVYYTDRLRALRAKIGMGAESASNSQPRTPIIDNRTLADSIDENGKQNIDPKFDLPSLHPQSARREPQMDSIRQRLQHIKSSNR